MYNNASSSPVKKNQRRSSSDTLLNPPPTPSAENPPPSTPPTSSAISPPVKNSRLGNKKIELKHPSCRNWLIHLHYVRKEFSTCKSIITEELLRLNGESEYANYIMALILRGEGKMQESLDKLQICHQLEPTNSNIVNQIARSLFLLGRHKLAINAYKKAQVLNDETDWETNYNMGLSYLYLKDFVKVKEHMNLSLQARVSQEAFLVLAQIALINGSLAEAVSTYERALRIFPDSPELLSNLGILYLKIEKHGLAFEKFGSSLAFDSINCKALVGLASLMQTNEDYDFALAKYKTAMQYLPDSSSLLNNIGMCFFGKKKFVAAISCLKRAYYLCAFDWKILHNLGLVHLHMQQYASAFHFLTASINLKPDESKNFLLLAVTISHLDDIEHAIQAYNQSLNLHSQHSENSIDLFNLHLNFSISLFNHKMYKESYSQLIAAQVDIEKLGMDKLDNDSKELFNRVKTALRMMDYHFPEIGALSTTIVSMDQKFIDESPSTASATVEKNRTAAVAGAGQARRSSATRNTTIPLDSEMTLSRQVVIPTSTIITAVVNKEQKDIDEEDLV